ncbi:Ribosome subunit biogenesis protein NIP7 [Spironucleus salmonicida]|uniref:60S ribosome subunit biogenesis protein NIP7 homolog n=1 Tax=Spironucleus salmonicida TaxID=348837 RepID=V6LG74_9EUKA|nr:Ribosome subunit biogenesis protein NIP7 [Spironucleus salmonicida]|eukprot:EST43560.1 Ribosome subunit biogenesis protein NIP7 [Spironucleus salmonicida]
MRELKDTEATAMFEKLAKFIGEASKILLDRKDADFVFRVIKNRVYYLPKSLENYCHPAAADNLCGAGVFIGKLTHHGRFHLSIPALPLLEQFAPHRVHLTKNATMGFLYGNDVNRAQIGKITDQIPDQAGVLVCDTDGFGIGFGVSTKSGIDAMRSEYGVKIVIRQGDVGEYLRSQEGMF